MRSPLWESLAFLLMFLYGIMTVASQQISQGEPDMEIDERSSNLEWDWRTLSNRELLGNRFIHSGRSNTGLRKRSVSSEHNEGKSKFKLRNTAESTNSHNIANAEKLRNNKNKDSYFDQTHSNPAVEMESSNKNDNIMTKKNLLEKNIHIRGADIGMRFAGLGKKNTNKQAMDFGMRFVGLGKKALTNQVIDNGMRFIGLGKKKFNGIDSGMRFAGLGKRSRITPNTDMSMRFVGLGKKNSQSSTDYGMRFAGLGKRGRVQGVDSGMRFVGLGKKNGDSTQNRQGPESDNRLTEFDRNMLTNGLDTNMFYPDVDEKSTKRKSMDYGMRFAGLGKKRYHSKAADTGMRFAGLGKRSPNVERTHSGRTGVYKRSVPEKKVDTGMRFVGLGKREIGQKRVDGGMRFVGLGKKKVEQRRIDMGMRFAGLGKRKVKERRVDAGMRFAGLGKRLRQLRIDTGMRFVGLGKRFLEQRRVDAGMRFAGLGKRNFQQKRVDAGMRFAGLGKRDPGYRPVDAGMQFAGLGKRLTKSGIDKHSVDSSMRFVGLGKRYIDQGMRFAGLGKKSDTPEVEKDTHVDSIDKRTIDTGMRFIGLGKRFEEKEDLQNEQGDITGTVNKNNEIVSTNDNNDGKSNIIPGSQVFDNTFYSHQLHPFEAILSKLEENRAKNPLENGIHLKTTKEKRSIEPNPEETGQPIMLKSEQSTSVKRAGIDTAMRFAGMGKRLSPMEMALRYVHLNTPNQVETFKDTDWSKPEHQNEANAVMQPSLIEENPRQTPNIYHDGVSFGRDIPSSRPKRNQIFVLNRKFSRRLQVDPRLLLMGLG